MNEETRDDTLFNGIEAGLKDALAFAQGDMSRGKVHIPKEMKEWKGGKEPPQDWNREQVILRDGTTEMARDIMNQQWEHIIPGSKWDIIAYTPKGEEDDIVERALAGLLHLEAFAEGDDLKRVRDAIAAINHLKDKNVG